MPSVARKQVRNSLNLSIEKENIMAMMKAVVVEETGAPDVLQIKQVARPEAREGWVLVHVRAFGLNRSEMFTRQGHSPDVEFPRILGIEAVGEVEDDPGGTYQKGQKVASVMGEMGRQFDGGYAEYTLLPIEQIMPIESSLSWDILGAIPEMFLTVWGSLTESLEMQAGQSLLVRRWHIVDWYDEHCSCEGCRINCPRNQS